MRIVKIDTLPSKVALSIKPRIRIVKRNQASQEKYNLYKCEQIDLCSYIVIIEKDQEVSLVFFLISNKFLKAYTNSRNKLNH